MNPPYLWFIVFFCVGYLIVTDQSIARLFILLTKYAEVQYRKILWWAQHSPTNPIVKWLMWRRAYKLAKELQEELESRNK
jgi:hypothetical protein